MDRPRRSKADRLWCVTSQGRLASDRRSARDSYFFMVIWRAAWSYNGKMTERKIIITERIKSNELRDPNTECFLRLNKMIFFMLEFSYSYITKYA